MMLILIVACFLLPPAAQTAVPLPLSAAALPLLSMGTLVALVSAMRNVLLTYDGWYSPIYLAEENTDPGRDLPRALIGGTVVLIVLYVAVNAALLRVLPLPALASSDLPAAAAARMVFPHGGGELVTLISLLTVLSLVNATLLITPRVLLAIGRDGLFTRKAAAVSAGGTPRLALAVSSVAAIALILSGTFEQIIALATVLFLLNYISAYAALFALRRREPDLPRPYRAFGFPFTTGIVLAGSVLALIAAAAEDPRSALVALLLLAACAPIYAALARRRRLTEGRSAAEMP
jgi:APA family basic amino acid/polyamine antiporter